MLINKPQAAPAQTKQVNETSGTLQQLGSWFLAVGLFISGLGSAFAPWIWRQAVALQLTAPGLAEFVKFLPEVRAQQIQLNRLYFLAPLFVTMLALPLFGVNRQVLLAGWQRWLLRLTVIPLALAALPPVWTPAILRAPEFRWQTLLAGLAVGLAVIAPLLKQLPLKPMVILWGLASVTALALAWWQFSLVQPGIAEAYHETIVLGIGWWLNITGFIAALIGAVLIIRVSGSYDYFRKGT